MRLSKHQEIAFSNPCFEAIETFNTRFYWLQEVGAVRLGVGLTANCGLE